MFWISKKSTHLKGIWNNTFIDIHNHLLPNIDDGSKSIAQTQQMIEKMQELGIVEAIATPHTYPGLWDNNKEKIDKNNTKNNIEITFRKISVKFMKKCSSEYFADQYLLALAEAGTLLPIKDNYLLFEFAMIGPPNDAILDTLFQLKLKGYQLILAHPERYQYWSNDIALFDQLKSFDLHFQLNALSLLGYYGKSTQKLAETLLANGHYDFLGTDFHTLEQIEFAKNNTFNARYSSKLEALVEANTFFETK